MNDPHPEPVTTLAALDQICRETFECEVSLAGGHKARLKARYLTPAEDARITLIVRQVPPKMIPGIRAGEQVPDMTDPDYIQRLQAARLKARALTLYLCVPAFAEERPGLTDLEQVAQFVQGRLHEDILEMLYEKISAGLVSLEDKVNFFLPRGSRPS